MRLTLALLCGGLGGLGNNGGKVGFAIGTVSFGVILVVAAFEELLIKNGGYLLEYERGAFEGGIYFSSFNLAKATTRSKLGGDKAMTSLLILTFKPLRKQFKIASSDRPTERFANDINFKW